MSQCARQYRIRDTVVETLHQVMPTHTNPLGTLHGGVMLRWMVSTATMAAMRVARGYTVLARMDNVFFINPVHLGDTVAIQAWVDLVGRTSMELTVLVEAESPGGGERRLTTVSHLTMVAIDERLKPRIVPACVIPGDPYEESLAGEAERRRRERRNREERLKALSDLEPPKPLYKEYSYTSYRLVNPEDSIAYNIMHAGRLLYQMDELAAITAMKYSRGIVVTASVDATDFYTPIRVGEVLKVYSALTYIGNTSMEVTLKAITLDPLRGAERHAATSYYTMVHIGPDGRPKSVPRFTPEYPWQGELYKQALARKAERMKALRFIRERLKAFKPPLRTV